MAIRMRAFLSTLLLLFFFTLFVIETESQKVPKNNILTRFLESRIGGIVKRVTKKIVKHEAKETLKDFANQTMNPPAPPPSDAPVSPEKIDGLHFLKEYLNDYGYIQENDSYTDLMDSDTVSAIRSYQTFFNLPVTGNLSYETVEQLLLFRCAVPDVNFTYNLSPSNNVSWPKGKNWFSNRTNLTYGFLPENDIPDNFTEVFRDSFQRWSEAISEVVNLTFMETRYDDADIKIGFYTFNSKTVGGEVVGTSLIELASNDGGDDVAVGNMLLDVTKYWALPNDTLKLNSTTLEYGVIDLDDVVMHHIGHLLGLSHSSHNESVMYPYILPENQRKVQLSHDDKQQINQVYSPHENGNGVGYSPWGLINTPLLGFACMFLLY
ncbi:hypothetical protein PIB30_003196 [Stylosanthes scabra]|uniref:Peptidase metallopeptidase domain-containing protein n=1 Tax=Stylosanthes scabra TaxID=79078 RepID=A0ABU6Q325_9FABA|nr:hypothetical protein [Stylosanthes scabra]